MGIQKKYRAFLMWAAEAALVRVMRLDWPGKSIEPLDRMRKEVRVLPEIVSDYIHYGMNERQVLEAQQKRRYDPSAMLNETFNRAIETREHGLTDLQMKALEIQKRQLAHRAGLA